jgi:hypothetical protein
MSRYLSHSSHVMQKDGARLTAFARRHTPFIRKRLGVAELFLLSRLRSKLQNQQCIPVKMKPDFPEQSIQGLSHKSGPDWPYICMSIFHLTTLLNLYSPIERDFLFGNF